MRESEEISMANIELVIKIPEEEYKIIKNYTAPMTWIERLIKNGTPLPKGHGRLIDADKFLKDNEAYTGFILNSRFFGGKNAYKDALEDLVDEASTIIEKDKKGNNDE
jgi:hypothetical protein